MCSVQVYQLPNSLQKILFTQLRVTAAHKLNEHYKI